MRVALYARYSSDLQSQASIDDQLRECSEYAQRQGWRIVDRYTDAAISGASLHRPGMQALILAAQRQQFEVALAESLDRFSRDQEDTASLFKRFSFYGVQLVTVTEQVIGPLHIGLKGTMNALYLSDLSQRTHRGLRGLVERGKSAGGRCYGYRVTTTGERAIHDGEAVMIVRIFREYVAGISPTRIAQALNLEHVAGPHGSDWGPTTIHGHAKRGTGILNNELYIGRIVWNRQRFVKNPETGKRLARIRPAAELVVCERPELRIVPEDLWVEAKQRQASTRHQIDRAMWRARRHQYLFSGLLHCAVCGYGYVSYGSGRLACTGARDRGVCQNRRTIARREVEQRVLDAIEHKAMRPELFDVFCAEVRAAAHAYTQAHRSRAAVSARERATLDRAIASLVQFIKDGGESASVRTELAALEARKAAASVETFAPRPRLTIPANLAAEYRAEFARLRQDAEAQALEPHGREALRAMVVDVRLQPDAHGLAIEVTGTWSPILDRAGLPLTAVEIDGCGGSQPTIPTVWTLAA